jgi:hypothetical protein
MNSNFITTALLGVAFNRIPSSISLTSVVNLSIAIQSAGDIWVFFALFLLILWV